MYASTLIYLLGVSLLQMLLHQPVRAQITVTTSPWNTLNKSLLYPDDAESPADIILGALFPIHSTGESGLQDCGPIQGEDGIYALEALLFTLNEINNRKDLLPGIKLGVLALDSCHSPYVALQQSLRFIKGFISSENAHHGSKFSCRDGSQPVYDQGRYDKVVGVIGGQRSSVSLQMANVLRLFQVPQISYRSTSASLSDPDRFPYFLRTVPTDNNQAEVILKVLEFLNVTYASLVYSETEYGFGGLNELVKKAKETTVCFANPPLAAKPTDPPSKYEEIVQKLDNRNTEVVVLFADATSAIKLLRVVHQLGRKFFWIGSDAWTSNSKRLVEFKDIMEGSIGIQPLAKTLPRFKRYFTQLTPEHNKINPWFNEFWEYQFNCSLSEPECANNRLRKGFVDVQWLHFLRDAAFSFAHAIHNMWETECEGVEGICDQMAHGGHVHGEEVYDYLRNVSFQDISNQTFKFLTSGSGTPRYTIFEFRSSKKDSWVPVANFTYKSSIPDVSFIDTENFAAFPESSCGKPCGKHQAQIISKEDTCCWRCETCEENQFLNSNEDSSFCESCDDCQEPNEERNRCVDKRLKYMDFKSQWAITSMAFSSLGIFSTVFVGIIFWVHLDTPVIKAASRELSYILLTGILISFLMTFVILAPPSPVSCGMTRFFLGFCYTVCYSAILTKTNRIYRIFIKNPSEPQKAKYTSPTSQMVIVLLLVCIEVIINVSWLMYYPPRNKKICEKFYNILICKGADDFSYIIGFLYPFFLVCCCTVYAIKTRKCPDGFNEAKYIAFTNYATCVIWIIFTPLYLTTPAKDAVRLVSLAMSLSLGAFIQLGCLFFPKVHIVLFKPEKNTRDSVMSQPRSISQGQQNSNIHIRNTHSAPTIGYVKNKSSTYPEGISNTLQKGHSAAELSHNNSYMNGDNNVPNFSSGTVNPVYLTVPGSHEHVKTK